MRAKSMAVIGLGALVFAASALPAGAGDGEKTVRFGLLHSNPMGDLSESGQTTELDSATGIFVSAEFRVRGKFGIEPGLGYAEHDITVDEPGFPTLDFGETTWTALTVNGNFHLLDEGKIDFFVGPTLGYVFWDSIDTSLFPMAVPTEDEFAFGVNLGLDVPFGESAWAFSGALRYLVTDLGIEGGSGIGVDPLQIKIGLAVDF